MDLNQQTYTEQNGYEYSKCDFEIILKKKKTLTYSKRYVYFNKSELVICKAPYQNVPRKIIQLDPFCHIIWITDKKKQNLKFEEKTVGFKIYNEDNQKLVELYGDKIAFKDLRKHFAKILFETNLLDDFDLLEKIGKGKYARVYKIEDKITKKHYAAKFLDKQKMMAIEFGKESLLNELNILRMVNHPNCIQLIRTYKEEKGYFIVTALLNPKKTLQDELQRFRNPSFGFPLVKSIIKQLLEGCKYFHQLGIMHRDLKPQNIMFADTNSTTMNQLKIIDFGLAQFTSAKKYMYVHVGTPGYVAPEILANESDNHTYTEQCDIFSIGVIFHVLLTGKTVFQGTKFHEVLKLNKRAVINLQGQRYQEMNQDAYNLLKLMLQQNPRLRITASEALKHNYFQEDVQMIQRNNSVHNLDIINEESSPVIKYRKKHSLQFFGRYQSQNTQLTHNQQQRIIQQLKSPESLKFDEGGQQKLQLYKLTNQLISIIYNKQTQEYADFDNPFSSTSSPLRFNLQKSRLNSVDSFQGYGNSVSPLKKEIGSHGILDQNQQLANNFKQITPKRSSLDVSPHKKFSVSSNKKNYEMEIFKEEEEYKYSGQGPVDSSSNEMHKKKPISEFKYQSEEIKKTQYDLPNQNQNNNKNNKNYDNYQESNTPCMLKQTPPKIEDSEQANKFQFLSNTQKAKNTSIYFSQLENEGQQLQYINNNNGSLQQNQLQKKSNSTSSSTQINQSQIKTSNSIQSPYKQSNTPQLKQVSGNQNNEDLNNQQQKNQTEKILYPKEILLMMDYFPENMIQCFLKKNPENSKGIRLLGLFLLFGQDKYIKNDNRTQIIRRFEHIKKNNIHDVWFIELLQQMLDDKLDLLNLHIKLEKGISEKC